MSVRGHRTGALSRGSRIRRLMGVAMVCAMGVTSLLASVGLPAGSASGDTHEVTIPGGLVGMPREGCWTPAQEWAPPWVRSLPGAW
jgi:hypothetical protein